MFTGSGVHRGEHLLGEGAEPGAVATADLARDDGRPDRLLGPPVGGLHIEVVEEGEQVGQQSTTPLLQPLSIQQPDLT